MLAGHCCLEALSTQPCKARIQETISLVGQEDIFMKNNRAAPTPASADPQLLKL